MKMFSTHTRGRREWYVRRWGAGNLQDGNMAQLGSETRIAFWTPQAQETFQKTFQETRFGDKSDVLKSRYCSSYTDEVPVDEFRFVMKLD